MKILNLAALVAVTAAAALGSAQGRPPMGGPGMGGPGGMRGPMTPQQQADMMTGRMAQMAGLTPAEQAKIKPIMLKYAISAKRLQDERMAALKKVLPADKMAKLATMRGMGGGRPGMGGPGMGGRPGMGGPGGMRRGG